MIKGSVANVLDYGAVGDGTTDDTAAIQAAIDANPDKTIFLPKGIYLSSGLTISSNNTLLLGEGMTSGGTVIRPSNTTGNDVTFTGTQQSGMHRICIQPIVKKTSGYAVYVTGSAFRVVIDSVGVAYGYNGFGIVSATETRISNCQVRYLLGVHGVYFSGTSLIGSYRAIINNFEADNPYPLATAIAGVKSWTATTAFSLNDIVDVSGAIWQCTSAGTSGSTAPSGYPGTTAQTVFSAEITDGSVKWKFVSLDSLIWIVQDNYAYSLVINEAALLNGARGFAQIDSAATGTSYPIWCYAWDLECDHSFYGGVTQFAGENIVLNGSWLGSSLNGSGFTAGPLGRGEIYIGAGTRIMGHALNGVTINEGPNTIIIDGCFIGVNSNKTLSAYHGISIAANVTEFQITNNKIGLLPAAPTNLQGYAVFIAAGTSDEYVIANNNVVGNTLGSISDNGSGTTKRIANNIGFNPTIFTSISVTASPFTWTNNTGNTVSVAIETGTVSEVLVAGLTTNTATNCMVTVPQGMTVTVTYSSLPIILFSIH
jgi:hypothetical protein